MDKENKIVTNRTLKEQNDLDKLASGLSLILGARVVPKGDFDKINERNKKLLQKTKDINKLRMELWSTECKLQGFVRYHKKWKPTTKQIVKRLEKLNKEELYIDFSDFPSEINENIREAYNCYVNGLKMACYIMILRTIELTVNRIYEKENPVQYNTKGKPLFIPALQKLNWVKQEKMIGGADYTLAKAFIEARNDSVHENFVPTEKQLMSAFETVINLIQKLKDNLH